jgi:hypothetical protein
MFTTSGTNTRITGIILEGEMFARGYGGDESSYLVGVVANSPTNFQVDNCELRGFAYADVITAGGTSWIHHCYIHDSKNVNEGYGVNTKAGTALIEGCLFFMNRHDVTGEGRVGEGYEVRYCHVLGNTGDITGMNHFDVHKDEGGGAYAGDTYRIHHNTIETDTVPQMAVLHMRACPSTTCAVYNNDIKPVTFSGTGTSRPVYQSGCAAYTKIVCTDNKWNGTIFPTNTGFVV